MEEVTLTNDLTQLTTEIKTYQSIGGQAIFEIGRRLKWVKENDLAHGEYLKWLSSIHMDRTQASRFIKIVSELPNDGTYQHLGMRVLSEIATMPESERDKPQHLPSGEVKKPDEMTVRELREAKKQLRARDSEIADKDAQIQELSDKEPEVVEKLPEDYDMLKGMVDNQKATLDRYVKDNADLRNEIDGLHEQLANAEPETSSSFNDLLANFIGQAFPLVDSDEFSALMRDPSQAKSIRINIAAIDKWCKELQERFRNATVIEGDFSNDK
ncbi:DUF3102 domain-containing protein [Levilactobacillus enshiensis]|uniref:DUF3102 domain-containing protein n=1 Tax=Levilactobacillus enshiensis TaxID=2590213 RepID=UPI00117A6F41|nr:DUF3102 domain-containing protein [Levilactobacillus enshiensis]